MAGTSPDKPGRDELEICVVIALALSRRRDAWRGLALCHHAVEPLALLVEIGELRTVERTAARQLDAHRIDEAAIHQDFVVHMRAGGEAGRADEADHLTLA